MSRVGTFVAMAWVVATTFPSRGWASPRPLRLSLAQAQKLAHGGSPDVAASSAGIAVARARRKAAFHLYFPSLKITGNVLYWDSDLPFDIPPVQSSPDCPLPAGCLSLFTDLFENIKIRERFTAQISVQLVQPLTPLYSIYQLNRLHTIGVKVAKARLSSTRQRVRHEVTRAYIQAYQAQTMAAIMGQAEDLVRAHRKRVATLLAEDVVRRAELLKVRVKALEVQRAALEARAAVKLSRANLARLMGLKITTPLVLTERFSDPPPPFRLTLAQCTSRALRHRSELKLARLGAAQLRAGRRATLGRLIPTVAAIARFDANHGLGVVMPRTSFFVGAVLRWEFQWGRKVREADALTARINRLGALERKAKSAIPLQVKKLLVDMDLARASLKLAKAAVAAAKESHRIQVERFRLRANTSTDVLDAQMALTRARASATNALYQYYLAKAALEAAMGDER